MITKDAKKLDQVLAALANEKRRRIVYALALQPASIGQLEEPISIAIPLLSLKRLYQRFLFRY